LPENLDINKADAQIDRGILTIKIPKIISEPEKAEIKITE
jgi:HSP20 family molecular chaperone IbpA